MRSSCRLRLCNCRSVFFSPCFLTAVHVDIQQVVDKCIWFFPWGSWKLFKLKWIHVFKTILKHKLSSDFWACIPKGTLSVGVCLFCFLIQPYCLWHSIAKKKNQAPNYYLLHNWINVYAPYIRDLLWPNFVSKYKDFL